MNTNANVLSNTTTYTMLPKQKLRMAFNQSLLLAPAILMTWLLTESSADMASDLYLFIFLDVCLYVLAAVGIYSIIAARLTVSKEGLQFQNIRKISAAWSEVKRIKVEKDKTYLMIEKQNDRGQPVSTRIPISWFGDVHLDKKSSTDPLEKQLRSYAPHVFGR